MRRVRVRMDTALGAAVNGAKPVVEGDVRPCATWCSCTALTQLGDSRAGRPPSDPELNSFGDGGGRGDLDGQGDPTLSQDGLQWACRRVGRTCSRDTSTEIDCAESLGRRGRVGRAMAECR